MNLGPATHRSTWGRERAEQFWLNPEHGTCCPNKLKCQRRSGLAGTEQLSVLLSLYLAFAELTDQRLRRGSQGAGAPHPARCRMRPWRRTQLVAWLREERRWLWGSAGTGLRDGFSIAVGQSPNAAGVCPSGCCWNRRDAPRLGAAHEAPGPASGSRVPTARCHLPRAAGK